jgi:hypothetical protein
MITGKKAMFSVSNIVLVVGTILLVSMALFMFAFKQADVKESLDVSGINAVYTEAKALDFMLEDISDRIVFEENPDLQFLDVLEKYKGQDGNYLNPYLRDIEKQTDNNHVYFNGKKLFVNFEVNISQIVKSPDGKNTVYNITYAYKFSKEKEMLD